MQPLVRQLIRSSPRRARRLRRGRHRQQQILRRRWHRARHRRRLPPLQRAGTVQGRALLPPQLQSLQEPQETEALQIWEPPRSPTSEETEALPIRAALHPSPPATPSLSAAPRPPSPGGSSSGRRSTSSTPPRSPARSRLAPASPRARLPNISVPAAPLKKRQTGFSPRCRSRRKTISGWRRFLRRTAVLRRGCSEKAILRLR